MDEFDNLIEKDLEYAENSSKRSSDKVLNKLETFALAERMLNLTDYKFYTIRNKDNKKEMPMYKGELGYYVPFGETYIQQWCSKNFRTSDKTVIDRLLTTIQGRTFIDRKDFTHPVNLINLSNGVFDLKSGKLLKHDSKYNFQGILGISYDKEAKCPKWENALKGMLPDDNDRIRTQKWFGYHFERENKEQIAHGYFGESGSGKSKILMILRDLLGEKNVTHFQLQDFDGRTSEYAIGRLYEKYANINFDMSTAPIKDISNFKMLTSGDGIQGRNIYESPFEFVNNAKLSWACNKLPIVSDRDINSPEFKRRIMLTKMIIGHEKVDKDIYNKFKSELSGIFNWAIEGYNLYKEEDGFNFNHEKVPSIWRDNMHDNGILSNFDTLNKSDTDNILYIIELEKQEIETTKSLEELQKTSADKTVENVLKSHLMSIQKTINELKSKM